jgi:uncharacterized membrane protein HdeD (DUF308 family)
MHSSITLNWWAIALRGVAAILLGIAAFALTGITLLVLLAVFVAYLFIDGVFALVAGVRGRSWILAIEGALGIIVGVIALVWPNVTLLALALLIAAWAILTGIAELAAAVSLRRVIRGEWLLALGGVLSIVFGIVVALFPAAGLFAIVYVIGAYALVWGVILLALAFRLRGYHRTPIVAA